MAMSHVLHKLEVLSFCAAGASIGQGGAKILCAREPNIGRSSLIYVFQEMLVTIRGSLNIKNLTNL